MKSCGIIVEYNPFHNGHHYHAQMARQLSGADVVIAIMSGNFLQRGEPALLDKWTRANEALANGVDLVVELPFAYAVQSADYFAKGGIFLLQAMQSDAVCFGTENHSLTTYEAFGAYVQENQQEINQLYQQLKNNGMSYPQQMTTVFRQLYPELPLDFPSPNHILGLSYAKENAAYKRPMTLYPLKRVLAPYHKTTIDETIASATAIRTAYFKQQRHQLNQVVPHETMQDLQQMPAVRWENYWPLLKYQLTSSSLSQLRTIYQMKEGLEYRLQEGCKQANSFQEFIEKIKTKRYTWTRLQRLCTYVLTNTTQAEVEAVWSNGYLHVLGFTAKGQQFLHENQQTFDLPVLTKVAKTNNAQLALDIRTSRIYQLGNEAISSQDFGRTPIRLT